MLSSDLVLDLVHFGLRGSKADARAETREDDNGSAGTNVGPRHQRYPDVGLPARSERQTGRHYARDRIRLIV